MNSYARTRVPKISQKTLAEMVSTTRSRVGFFMIGSEDWVLFTTTADCKSHSSLLNVVLHD